METKTFEQSFDLSKKFESEVIKRLAPLLIVVPPIEEDLHRNTDLWLACKKKRIAYRIRNHAAFSYDDFTIRYKTTHGHNSEYSKILMGFGEWLFYGIANEDESKLLKWRLYCLDLFRGYVSKGMALNGPDWLPGELKTNRDGSQFIIIKDNVAFKIDWGE